MQQQQQQQQEVGGAGGGGGRSSIIGSTTARVNSAAPETLLSCLRVFGILIAIGSIISAVLTLLSVGDCEDCPKTSIGILSFYTVVFALLLLCFEMPATDKYRTMIKRNFGFFYTHRGKAAMLVFLSTLLYSAISLDNKAAKWVSITMGTVAAVTGAFICCLYYSHPTFSQHAYGPAVPPLARRASAGANQGPPQHAHQGGPIPMGAIPNSGGYEFGNVEGGNTYGAYGGPGGAITESPYEFAETKPQPPMGPSPYAEAGHDDGGMPFGSGQGSSVTKSSTTVTMQETSARSGPRNEENPFAKEENPFSEV